MVELLRTGNNGEAVTAHRSAEVVPGGVVVKGPSNDVTFIPADELRIVGTEVVTKKPGIIELVPGGMVIKGFVNDVALWEEVRRGNWETHFRDIGTDPITLVADMCVRGGKGVHIRAVPHNEKTAAEVRHLISLKRGEFGLQHFFDSNSNGFVAIMVQFRAGSDKGSQAASAK